MATRRCQFKLRAIERLARTISCRSLPFSECPFEDCQTPLSVSTPKRLFPLPLPPAARSGLSFYATAGVVGMPSPPLFFKPDSMRVNPKDHSRVRVVSLHFLLLAHLHKRGIAHCDLKLENYLMESSQARVVKLIDFRTARAFREGELFSKPVGSSGCRLLEPSSRP